MLLSIIIPVYNVEDYFEFCMQSILPQLTDETEVILIDDGSTDKSSQMCDYYAENFNKIKVMHQKNAGQSAARNVGIKLASGKYIEFVDSDDAIASDAIKNILAEIKTKPDVILLNYTYDEKVDGTAKIYEEAMYKKYQVFPTLHSFFDEMISKRVYSIPPWRTIILKDFLIQNKLFFYEGIIFEDFEWSVRVHSLMQNVKVIQEPMYFYRKDRSGNTSNIKDYKRLQDNYFKIALSLNDFQIIHKLSLERKAFLDRNIALALSNSLINAAKCEDKTILKKMVASIKKNKKLKEKIKLMRKKHRMLVQIFGVKLGTKVFVKSEK